MDQVEYLVQNKIFNPSKILYYNVPQEVMLERMKKRAETSGRADDTPEVQAKRVKVYFDKTQPMVDHYSKLGLLTEIDATSGIDEVYSATLGALQPDKSR